MEYQRPHQQECTGMCLILIPPIDARPRFQGYAACIFHCRVEKPQQWSQISVPGPPSRPSDPYGCPAILVLGFPRLEFCAMSLVIGGRHTEQPAIGGQPSLGLESISLRPFQPPSTLSVSTPEQMQHGSRQHLPESPSLGASVSARPVSRRFESHDRYFLHSHCIWSPEGHSWERLQSPAILWWW
jgi:hypothetical protein